MYLNGRIMQLQPETDRDREQKLNTILVIEIITVETHILVMKNHVLTRKCATNQNHSLILTKAELPKTLLHHTTTIDQFGQPNKLNPQKSVLVLVGDALEQFGAHTLQGRDGDELHRHPRRPNRQNQNSPKHPDTCTLHQRKPPNPQRSWSRWFNSQKHTTQPHTTHT